MPVLKITRRSVRGLGQGVYYDTELTGFGLRVNANGTGTWFVEYRPGAGGRGVAKRRLSIGKLDRLSPEQAREEAGNKLAAAQLGQDPAAERTAARSSRPFKEVAEDYLTKHVATKRKPGTAKLYRHLLQNHLSPQIGAKRINVITKTDVQAAHLAIRTAAGNATANRALALASSVFKWADELGRNPAQGIEKFPEQAKDRYLTTDEISALGAALTEAETTGIPYVVDETKAKAKHAPRKENRVRKFPIHITNAIRLYMFTGARLREILNLEWSSVDLQRGVLFLPDSKTGRKTVVLSQAAIDVLAATPRVGRYVIAGETAGQKDERPRADLKRPWAAISERAGVGGLRIHDLRHTFASVGAASGLGLPVIGKLLGHASSETTERYAHLATDASRRAADAIAGQIAAAMHGGEDGKD